MIPTVHPPNLSSFDYFYGQKFGLKWDLIGRFPPSRRSFSKKKHIPRLLFFATIIRLGFLFGQKKTKQKKKSALITILDDGYSEIFISNLDSGNIYSYPTFKNKRNIARFNFAEVRYMISQSPQAVYTLSQVGYWCDSHYIAPCHPLPKRLV